MIVRKLDETAADLRASDAADRLARAARAAGSDADAIEAVQRLLEEILT
jgi:hypothetical protein